MENSDAIHLGKRAASDPDKFDAACKDFDSPTRYPAADFKWREGFGASREFAQQGVLADIKNMLGEFSEKLRPLRQKVKSAARSEWLEHEAEAREKAKLGRERSKYLNRSEISPQTERELLNDQLHQAVRESRDTILRWDTFSSEFQNSKGWRECLRSILFKKSTGFIDMYYREVLCALPLIIETSDTLTSAINKPIAAFIMRSDVIDFVNLLPTEHALSRFWRKILGNQLSGSRQDGFEEPSTPLDSNTSRLVEESVGSSKITLIDHSNSGKNFTVKFRDTLESASHILVGANLPASVMMAIKHSNYSSLPITLMGPESKHNLGSWFGDIEGFDVLRTNLISESFCHKLVTSTDGDKCEAIATHIASLYYKTEQSFKLMIPEGSSLLPRLTAKLRERGINENIEFTKSKSENSDTPQGRRITFEKFRNHQRHFQDGSLPQNDEIRIYMTAPMALESLQRIMVHCSAYKSTPSSIILMYNHEEAYRLRNEKTLSLPSPELLLDILSKIQRSSEELPLNQLRVTRKEYGRNFELALELASSLLREFESRGSVKFVSEYTTEYEVKLAEPLAGSQSDDLLAAISRKTTKADSNPTSTLYSLTDFVADIPTLFAPPTTTLTQTPGPCPPPPDKQTNPDPDNHHQQQQLHKRLLDLHRTGRLSLLRPAGVALCFRKVDCVSSAEMSAAFFAAHEDAVLRVKAFDLMTAALFNNGVVALEHIKKPRQNNLGEQLQSILNNYYTSPDKVYESLADESKCSLNIPHEVHYMHFQLTQRMISSVLKDLKTYLETEYLAKGTPKSEIPKSLQHNIFLHRFSGLIRGCQVMKSLCLLIQEAHLANRELVKHLDRLSKVCPLVLMELVEKNLEKLGLQ